MSMKFKLLLSCVLVGWGFAIWSYLYAEEATVVENSLQQDSIPVIIKEWKLAFVLPSEAWKLSEHGEHPEKGFSYYIYKRTPIEDKAGRRVIPNVGVIFERLPEEMDVITYSVIKRIATPFKVDSVFCWESGPISIKNAVGYIGSYEDKGIEHTILVAHIVNDKIGIQVIMDATQSVYPKVEGEFKFMMKSMRLLK